MDTHHAQVLPFEPDGAPATTQPPPAGSSQDKQAPSQERQAAGGEPQGGSQQAAPVQSAVGDMSAHLLIEAGLTAFSGILLVMLIVMWRIDAEAAASLLRSASGTAFLIALAPVGLGAFLLRRNKKAEAPEPGLVWAKAGVYVGMLLAIAVVMIPAFVTLRTVVSSGPH